jgi:hypothetical protein
MKRKYKAPLFVSLTTYEVWMALQGGCTGVTPLQPIVHTTKSPDFKDTWVYAQVQDKTRKQEYVSYATNVEVKEVHVCVYDIACMFVA